MYKKGVVCFAYKYEFTFYLSIVDYSGIITLYEFALFYTAVYNNLQIYES
jgi:hypothetical protein